MEKKFAKIVQDEATAALKAIAEKHGLTVLAAGGIIGVTDMTLKFKFTNADPAVLAAAEKEEFQTYARLFGLEPSDHGAKFTANGKLYTVVGFDMKRRKYPILVVDQTGKRSCFTEVVVDRIKAARA